MSKLQSGIIAVSIRNNTGQKMARRVIAGFLGMFVLACGGCGGGGGGSSPAAQAAPTHAASAPALNANVGFFTIERLPTEIIPNVSFANINALSTDQIAASLKSAQGTALKVNIDFTKVSTQPMVPASIGMTYHDLAGNQLTKHFSPILPPPKLKQFPSNDQLKAALDPYFDVLKRYAPNVGMVFLADEPYLNGISKSEMERAGAVARQELDARGLQSVKLGVIFAGGMFDNAFATMMDGESGEYAKKWDSWYQHGQAVLTGQAVDPAFDPTAFNQWTSSFGAKRLTTYDLAGNMYTGGGIPQGFDVVSFDFYLGTLLLDSTYDNSLAWFAANFPNAGCDQFAGQTVSQIRKKLSFFNDGPQLVGQQYLDSDRALLDAIYQCRMRATTAMLEKDLAGRNVDLLMISGSTSNDVLEYDTAGNPKQDQPPQLIESRMVDEVWRAQNFYSSKEFRAGLAFFTYEDEYDSSINESIGGASGMPNVMASIYQFSKTGVASPRQ